MMMVGRSAAGQLPYSPLIQLSLIVRTTDLKNKQKDKRFIKRCFFLSFFTIDDFNKKKLSCEIIFLQIQFFQRKCFFQWKCCIKIFFPDCAFPSLPMSVIEESCSDPTPVQENSRQENKLSFPVTFNPHRLAPTRNPTLDGFNAELFFTKIREIWYILTYNFHKNPLCVLSSLYTFQSTQKHH